MIDIEKIIYTVVVCMGWGSHYKFSWITRMYYFLYSNQVNITTT